LEGRGKGGERRDAGQVDEERREKVKRTIGILIEQQGEWEGK
jgi:hypothetical protein